ncbi:MAG: hypothetical protein ACP5P9_00520 [Acidimicrobiales bacterium]
MVAEAAGLRPDAAQVPGARPPALRRSDTDSRGWGLVVLAGAVYLVLAVGLWWHVWTSHPSAVTTCGCGDAARFTWFFAWPVFALGHGQSLWHSTWLFHPRGFNLLDDTSVLALTVPLAPVTWLWGPVAAMNVAATLAPATSALAMFVLLRRWVRPVPGALVGGLLYGFSPFVLTELALNQLNLAVLVVPPLLALVLVDLVSGKRSPVRSGVFLGVLAAVQFFLSTEMLLIVVVTGACGLLLALVRWWWRLHRGRLGEDGPAIARRVVGGLAAGAAVGAVLLAVPAWYATAGPSHLSGPIWGNSAIDHFGSTPATSVAPSPMAGLAAEMHHFGGYQGPALPALGYLGAGVVALVVVAAPVWWRRPRYQLVASVAAASWLLSLAPSVAPIAPWRALVDVPLVGNIVEVRFAAITTGCLAVLAAVVVDRASSTAPALLGRRSATTSRPVGTDTVGPFAGTSPGGAAGLVATAGSRTAGHPRWPRRPERGERPGDMAAAVAVGLAVAVTLGVAVGPSAAALASNLPLVVQSVRVPRWFADPPTSAGHLPVVLAYPAPFSGIQSSMAWQALGGLHVAMAGGGGPASLPSRAGTAQPGLDVLSAASIGLGPPPVLDRTALESVLEALQLWRVTVVVVPQTSSLLSYDRGRGDRLAATLFTAAIGRRPLLQKGSWVWIVPAGLVRPVAASASRLATCAALPVAAAATCVLGGST